MIAAQALIGAIDPVTHVHTTSHLTVVAHDLAEARDQLAGYPAALPYQWTIIDLRVVPMFPLDVVAA